MEKEVITIYCIIDDTLKPIGIKDNPQAKMSSSEILTTAVISCIYFGGNFRNALSFMSNYCSYVLRESRFHRKLKTINEKFPYIFEIIIQIIKQIPLSNIEEYSIDTFPIKICENIRANRCKIAPSKEIRGYIASKKNLFSWIKTPYCWF